MMSCFVYFAFMYSLFQDDIISTNLLLVIYFCRTMVYIIERFLSSVRHLVILSERNQLREDGLSLLVLQSSIHNEAPNFDRAVTLGQHLIEDQTHWGAVTKVPGEFCFTDCYWEWLELIVGRNAQLLYSARLYDDAYYSIVCTQRNDHATSFKNDSQVTISNWVSFWYLGSRSYDKLTMQKQKKASHSKSTQNLDGSKIQAREWSSRESMLFAELGIRDDLKDETHLATFLSCWLCVFVFPQKGSFLRPEVFRVASLMAASTIYSLAVPVLANIYHGLDWWTMRHETYFEDNRHHLAMALTLEEEVNEHKDESDSSKSDHHWKRPLKKEKVSGDDLDEKGSSALGVPNIPPLSPLNDHLEGLIELASNESLTGSHAVDSVFEEVGTRRLSPLNQPNSPYVHLLFPRRFIEDIQDKIMRTHFEYIPRLRPKIATVLSGIEKIHTDGLTPLEEYLNSYLKRTSAIKEALTLMEQLRGDAKVIQERAAELSLEKKELDK
ncbi:putative mitochondrial protein [Cucumis melo var. makuwa]|uniref:Mitochondrial protein n=1 Tax=Cucumis melo var. makuwa TaxID=1194695 RepID=A0A5A7UVA2_CUCMM|nr:putative mitochondrial protein [Cucumis melo var. makuwa]TYK24824.1 putative mitochondrial protein [Cucumis melo var. makuwa]